MSPQAHALTHGTNGVVLAYLAIQLPLLVGLVRGRVPFSKLMLSPVAAIALTVGMGIFFALASPLLRSLGVTHGSWLELALAVSMSAAVGYASGRLLAARTSASASYRRGAVVAEAAAHGARAGRGEADPRDSNTSV